MSRGRRKDKRKKRRRYSSQEENTAQQSVKLPSSATIKKALLGDYAPEDLHDYRIDRHTFTIFLGGEETRLDGDNPTSIEPGVEHNMADRFERNLHMLSGMDPNRPICIKQASVGGDWCAGMQMFSAILSCPNPTTVIAMRNARSMTSLIPLAADKFLLRPPAQYMFHHGTYAFSGLTQEALTDLLELLKQREMMLRIYTARLKGRGTFKNTEEKEIRKMLETMMEKRTDVWLSPVEARMWGLADGIISGPITRAHLATKRNEQRRKEMSKIVATTFKVEDLTKQFIENYKM